MLHINKNCDFSHTIGRITENNSLIFFLFFDQMKIEADTTSELKCRKLAGDITKTYRICVFVTFLPPLLCLNVLFCFSFCLISKLKNMILSFSRSIEIVIRKCTRNPNSINRICGRHAGSAGRK